MKMYRATKPVSVVARSMMRLTFDGLFGGFVLDLAAVRKHGLGEDFVAPVELDGAVLDEELQQIELILGVQLAGVLAEQARHVQRRDDRHLPDLRRLAGLRQLAVAAALGGEIDDDA